MTAKTSGEKGEPVLIESICRVCQTNMGKVDTDTFNKHVENCMEERRRRGQAAERDLAERAQRAELARVEAERENQRQQAREKQAQKAALTAQRAEERGRARKNN